LEIGLHFLSQAGLDNDPPILNFPAIPRRTDVHTMHSSFSLRSDLTNIFAQAGLKQKSLLLISASTIARITGIIHEHPPEVNSLTVLGPLLPGL
jgi:hypothetical protein